MVPADVDLMWDNSQTEPHMVYLVATDDETGTRSRHRHRHRPRATLRRPGERLQSVVRGRRPRGGPARDGWPAGAVAHRGVRRPRARADGPVGVARQRGRHRALRADGLRPGSRCSASSARTPINERLFAPAHGRGGPRPAQPVCADHRRRGDPARHRRRGRSTPRVAICGSRTAAPASSPGNRCPNSPTRSR